MSVLTLSVKHGRTLEDARAQLERSVQEVCSRFGRMIQRVEWAEDRGAVRMLGTGFVVDMRVDAQEVHVTADLPLLAGVLGGPLLSGIKQIVTRTFPKQLT